MRRGSLYYLDSSAVVKLVFEEKESDSLRAFLKQNLVSSDLTKIEVYRVCARLDKKSIEVANKVFECMSFFEINKKVIERTKKLVEIPYLKSLDSIHVSTALGIAELIDGFVTYDKQMIRAAKELELSVVSPV